MAIFALLLVAFILWRYRQRRMALRADDIELGRSAGCCAKPWPPVRAPL